MSSSARGPGTASGGSVPRRQIARHEQVTDVERRPGSPARARPAPRLEVAARPLDEQARRSTGAGRGRAVIERPADSSASRSQSASSAAVSASPRSPPAPPRQIETTRAELAGEVDRAQENQAPLALGGAVLEQRGRCLRQVEQEARRSRRQSEIEIARGSSRAPRRGAGGRGQRSDVGRDRDTAVAYRGELGERLVSRWCARPLVLYPRANTSADRRGPRRARAAVERAAGAAEVPSSRRRPDLLVELAPRALWMRSWTRARQARPRRPRVARNRLLERALDLAHLLVHAISALTCCSERRNLTSCCPARNPRPRAALAEQHAGDRSPPARGTRGLRRANTARQCGPRADSLLLAEPVDQPRPERR
jgi:hypothetical protein